MQFTLGKAKSYEKFKDDPSRSVLAQSTAEVIPTLLPTSSDASAEIAAAELDAKVFQVISPEEEDEDDQLPITANRHGTWLTTAYHNVTAMVGAGVLGLPFAFAGLGWGGGMVVMLLALGVSYFTFLELVHMHEIPNTTPTKRMNRYHELTCYAFGKKRGLWAIVPFQLAVMVGVAITYTVTGGSSLYSFYMRNGGDGSVKRTYWIIIFSAINVITSQLPSFNDLSWLSCMGSVMSLSYSLIAIILPIVQGSPPDVSYTPGIAGATQSDIAFGVLLSISTVLFAYGGHNIAMEIQASLPCPPSTVEPMMRGVNIAFVLTGACYFGVSIVGYAVFGNAVTPNVLDSIVSPLWAVSLADLMVVAHVASSYQVYSYPVFDMVEQFLLRQFRLRLQAWQSRTLRVSYVVMTCFVAALLPFFNDLMGLVGALAVTPTTFLMPAILWLVLKQPRKGSVAYVGNWCIIGVCSCLIVTGTLGAVRQIAVDSAAYETFS